MGVPKVAITIRKMIKKDMNIVQDIAITTWHATYSSIIAGALKHHYLKKAYSNQMMKQRLKQPYFFVAEFNGDVVGLAQFTVADKHGMTELVAIYLYPEYQGKGIGSAFLEKGIEYLEHANEIQLNVEKDNRQGRRFYEAKGFIVIDEYEEDFAGHILNTIRMSLKI